MVKMPVTVQSWKPMTIKVETGSPIDVSTAYGPEIKITLFATPKVVRTQPKTVFIEDHHHVNLTKVNRSLRGRREPVFVATGDLQERETA